MKKLQKIQEWIDTKLGITKSEKDVANIKKDAEKKVNDVTRSLKEQGRLQNLVIQKTTTYYIGKAMGVVK